MGRMADRIGVLALNNLEADRMDLIKKVTLEAMFTCDQYEETGQWLERKKIKERLGDYGLYEQIKLKQLGQTGKIRLAKSLFDLDYSLEDNSIKTRVYVSDSQAYAEAQQGIRTHLLGGQEYGQDQVFLVWLLKEIDLMASVFSRFEIRQIDQMLEQKLKTFPNWMFKFNQSLLTKPSRWWLKWIGKREEALGHDFWIGLNYVMPAIHRKNMVFIAMDQWFADEKERLDCLTRKLRDGGIDYRLIWEGKTPLIKISNYYYYVLPHAKRLYQMNIHGVQLRPKRLGD